MSTETEGKVGNERGYVNGPGCCCLGCVSGFLALFAGAAMISSLLPIILIVLIIVIICVGIAALIKYLKS